VGADFFIEFAPAGRIPLSSLRIPSAAGGRRRGEKIVPFFWKEKLAVGHEVRKRKLSVTSDSGPPVSGAAAGCGERLSSRKSDRQKRCPFVK
jgi:hypothetical protein